MVSIIILLRRLLLRLLIIRINVLSIMILLPAMSLHKKMEKRCFQIHDSRHR